MDEIAVSLASSHRHPRLIISRGNGFASSAGDADLFGDVGSLPTPFAPIELWRKGVARYPLSRPLRGQGGGERVRPGCGVTLIATAEFPQSTRGGEQVRPGCGVTGENPQSDSTPTGGG